MFRLVRGTGHILDVLDVLRRERLALRIHDGAFSAMGLTARPRTGELLSTVKFMVPTLAADGVRSGGDIGWFRKTRAPVPVVERVDDQVPLPARMLTLYRELASASDADGGVGAES